MNRRKSWMWSLTMLLITMAFIMGETRTLAVHNGTNARFELDGNAAEDATKEGDDWETVFKGTGSNTGQPNLVDDSVTVPDVTYYTGGKSKDIYDIPNWQYNANGTQDKAQITNAFAASYKGSVNEYLYFGADRYSNDGNTFIGFWFFQNEIATSGGKFTGAHKNGDLLVLSDFTNGGAVSTIKVYKWLNGALQTTGFSGSDCDSAAHAADPEGPCAKVNAGGETAYWNYTPKPNVGSPGIYPRGTFYEGGVNLNTLFPEGVPCFTTYLAETRASQEPNATLSDFALGQLGGCGLTVTKTARTTEICENASTPVIYDYVVTNTGTGTLNVNLSDDNGTANNTSDDVDIDDGTGVSLAGGTSRSFSRTFTLNTTTTNIVTATGTNGTFSATATDTETVTAYDCSISLTKTPNTTNVCAGTNTSVTYTYVVKNTGNKFNASGTLTDDKLGSIGSWGPLAPGTSATLTKVATINATTTNIGTASGTSGPAGGTLKSVSAAATATVNANLCEIRGKKFKDLTGNGPTADDTVLSGWTIQLWSNPEGAQPLATATTDANGEYAFLNLSPGSYIVKEVQQAGWNQTGPAAQGTHLVTIVATGTVSTGNDFHNAQLYKMVVFTCGQISDALVQSSVTLSGSTKDTIAAVPAHLATKGVTMADLCGVNMTGAKFENLPRGTHNPSVQIPK